MFEWNRLRKLENALEELRREVSGIKWAQEDVLDKVQHLIARLNARARATTGGDGTVAPPPSIASPEPTLDPVSAKIMARRKKTLAEQLKRPPRAFPDEPSDFGQDNEEE